MPQPKCPTCSSHLSFKHYLKNSLKRYPECPYCLKAYERDEIGLKTFLLMSVFFNLTCIISIFIGKKYKIIYLLDFSAFTFVISILFAGYFHSPLKKAPHLKSSLRKDFRYLARIFAITGIISVLFFLIIIIVLFSFKENFFSLS